MKIDIEVPDGISGEWRVETFTVQKEELSEKLSLLKYGRGVPAGTYKRLMRNGELVMSNTPDEIRDFWGFVCRAKGSVLVNGLGLGVLLKALLNKPEITDVTVIEKSLDVIKLAGETYLKDKRVTIINADAFNYTPPKGKRYNAVWHDIWDCICSDNLPEMKTLHRKYGRKTDYQESWCRWRCERAI